MAHSIRFEELPTPSSPFLYGRLPLCRNGQDPQRQSPPGMGACAGTHEKR